MIEMRSKSAKSRAAAATDIQHCFGLFTAKIFLQTFSQCSVQQNPGRHNFNALIIQLFRFYFIGRNVFHYGETCSSKEVNVNSISGYLAMLSLRNFLAAALSLRAVT